jgi:hypothetical protein
MPAHDDGSQKGRIHTRRPYLLLSLFACDEVADHTYRKYDFAGCQEVLAVTGRCLYDFIDGGMNLRRGVKVSLWLLGSVLVAVLGLSVFVLLSWGVAKDQTKQSAASPDGRFVAELHTVITPMHGGPDTLYVSIRGQNDTFGETVFSRVYECDDTSGFNIHWTGAEALDVSRGACDTGQWHTPADDRITTKQVVWRGVTINYLDTHHTAMR